MQAGTTCRLPPRAGWHHVQVGISCRLAPHYFTARMQSLSAALLVAQPGAAAAAGQTGLMALYDSLFTMMDMQAAQLLVTASDFEHDGAPRLSCHGSAVLALCLSRDTSASLLLSPISHLLRTLMLRLSGCCCVGRFDLCSSCVHVF